MRNTNKVTFVIFFRVFYKHYVGLFIHKLLAIVQVWCNLLVISEEKIITKIQKQIREQYDQDMGNVNGEENKFWKDLIQACLQPSSGAFSLETILKGS